MMDASDDVAQAMEVEKTAVAGMPEEAEAGGRRRRCRSTRAGTSCETARCSFPSENITTAP